MVWCEGMPGWQQADSVQELAGFLPPRHAAQVPPYQAYGQAPPPNQPYPNQPYPGQPYPQQQQYPQQGYPHPGMQPHVPNYGGPPASSNRVAAGLCGILLGALGVHKFILGYTTAGVVMLLVSLLTCGFGAIVMSIIGLIEGIIYLSKSEEDFHNTYVLQKKTWF